MRAHKPGEALAFWQSGEDCHCVCPSNVCEAWEFTVGPSVTWPYVPCLCQQGGLSRPVLLESFQTESSSGPALPTLLLTFQLDLFSSGVICGLGFEPLGLDFVVHSSASPQLCCSLCPFIPFLSFPCPYPYCVSAWHRAACLKRLRNCAKRWTN